MENLETKKNTSLLDIKKFLSKSKFIYFNKNINHFETIGPENDIMPVSYTHLTLPTTVFV